MILIIAPLDMSLASDAEESNNDDIVRLWPDNLFAVAFADAKHGMIAGEAGRVLTTKDGGANWSLHYIGQPELIRRVCFVGNSLLWAVGHRGSIFHSDDGGETWRQQYQAEGVYLRGVSFADASHGWAVGHNATILHTDDGGKSWHKQQLLRYKGRDLPRLHGVVAISATQAVAVGEFGVVAHTEDGGSRWLAVPSDANTTWTAIDALANQLIVVGLDGNIASLTPATAAQRDDIGRVLRQDAEREEAARARKAKLRYREYTPQPIEILLGDSEYVLTPIESSLKQHFFDIDCVNSGPCVLVGSGLIAKFSNGEVVPLTPEANLPVQFMWFGGVDALSDQKFVAVGIRGAVVEGSPATGTYQPLITVAGTIPDNINVENTNWDASDE